MPIFDYRCPCCNVVKEVIQKGSDQQKVECPNCNSKMEKQIGQSNFQLKGIGVYKNNTH
jgi:putative FmdB family regulatory protein